MEELQLEDLKHIHFVGIGGAGMGGIAEVLINQGFRVSGSDIGENRVTQHLQNLGAQVWRGHHGEQISGADVIVLSSAINEDNPEVRAARERQVPIIARAQMLGELMRLKNGIAVAGTHGKTTTTSLIASVLAEGKLDPTFVIGGLLVSAGTNARLGTSEYFVAEADESDSSFLYLHPKVAVITNIDADHLSTYNNDFDALQKSFLEFTERLPEYGLVVVCIDDPVIRNLIGLMNRPVLTYGFSEDADIRATNFKQIGLQSRFQVQRKNNTGTLDIVLNMPGQHNTLNALAAIAIATHCCVEDNDIRRALQKFEGVGRRFQVHGEFNTGNGRVTVVDDYGHHPKELEVTYNAIRQAWPDRRLVSVFQPHRYSRTHELYQDFVKVLAEPDELLLLDIYAAGEKPIADISSRRLRDDIANTTNKSPVFVEQISDIKKILLNVLRDSDILLVQGAGSIGKVAINLVEDWST